MAVEKRLTLQRSAQKCLGQGKIDAAIKQYRRLLELKPDDLETRRILGDLFLKQHDVNSAVEHFEWIADYYLKEGFFSKAIAMYKRITRVSPNYEDVYFKLADLYTKQGLVIEAKQIYLDLAEESKRKNNHKRALDMYKRILEFDRNNLKMRLLLADHYLREGEEDSAVTEYVIAADRLITKKDFDRAEEVLREVLKKTQNPKLVEKLVNCYTNQEQEQKAIELLTSLGSTLFKSSSLLKLLGELYFRSNRLDEAEKIFQKITEINPEEKEVILKLGKVYLQRREYDKTFQLFLPIIDQAIEAQRFEEATSLLRFIIASNSSHIPALLKLASIFKASGKKSNLIALYESLIPIYEEEEMKAELENILEELIRLSDSSFTYEEHLARLRGKRSDSSSSSREMSDEEKQQSQFIRFNMKVVDEAISEGDSTKAIGILQKTKETFPQNIEIRLKAFDVYQMLNQLELLVDEGIELLEIYRSSNNVPEFNRLLETLSLLKPNDPRLLEYTLNEKTNIEIDFTQDELNEQIEELNTGRLHEIDFPQEEESHEDDVFLLTDEDGMATDKTQGSETDGEAIPESALAQMLAELDGLLENGRLDNARQMLNALRRQIPDHPEVKERLRRLEQLKQDESFLPGTLPEDTGAREKEMVTESIPVEEQLVKVDEESLELDIDLGGFEIESHKLTSDKKEQTPPPPVSQPSQESIEDLFLDLDNLEDAQPQSVPNKEKQSREDFDLFNIQSSISDESLTRQEDEDSREMPLSETGIDMSAEEKVTASPGFEEMESISFEIDLEEPVEGRDLPAQDVDRENLIVGPDSSGAFKEERMQSSVDNLLDIDDIMIPEETGAEAESPFGDLGKEASPFDSDETLLSDGDLMMDVEEFLETENSVAVEREVIEAWMKEIERQRTSTTEKNMMEIFREFKKGVDEKIGEGDFDTRYNLGIAYKEMGLLEEAIHEFLISAKHPEKFFDSAGLLGLCFREKGMFSEAITWLQKALDVGGRSQGEYMAIRYELVLCYRLGEDLPTALKILGEMMAIDPDYRDVAKLFEEVRERTG
ncbi:MAG TPA: tetratricopeptide repeat protein [Candidatus Aminicenantes bacterium]|nr:tetratricopeptide repeat protein [Candidatus Aminicenantes bacterium]